MTIRLPSSPRILIEAELRPTQGNRFQPTGFPNLGVATYRLHDGQQMLLLESSQSVANRLEATILEPGTSDPMPLFAGISYVAVTQNDMPLTSSLVEAHRLNSPYILESGDRTFFERLRGELKEITPTDAHAFARVICRYDVNALLHGVFLAKSDLEGGRFRLRRALSGFIEAHGVSVVTSGGVKNDPIEVSGDASSGFGNVPFTRDEYTAERIVAYFNLDLAQIRAYRLGEVAEALLGAMALWKIHAFLGSGLRLRTACDLDVVGVSVTRPADWSLPSRDTLEAEIPALIAAVRAVGLFAEPPVTTVSYVQPAGAKAKKDKKAKSEAPV